MTDMGLWGGGRRDRVKVRIGDVAGDKEMGRRVWRKFKCYEWRCQCGAIMAVDGEAKVVCDGCVRESG